MIAAETTVAGMVGAAKNVSQLADYMDIFTRVFEVLGIKRNAFDIVKTVDDETGEPWISGEDIKDLEELYNFRNSLVHEINIAQMGHINVRDAWSPEDALRVGSVAARLMRSLERFLSAAAPRDFPNLLTETYDPVPRIDILLSEIGMLERRVDRVIEEFADSNPDPESSDCNHPDSVSWRAAKKAARMHLEVEQDFLSTASMLMGYRYDDLVTPLKEAVLLARVNYLKSILKVVGDVWVIDKAVSDAEN